MSKVVSFIRMDLFTLKPYYKSAFTIFGVGAIFGFVQRDAYAMAAICIMYALLLTAYPFTIGDKYELDMLYATLAIRRRTVVTGRYALVILLFCAVALVAVLLSYILARSLGYPFAWRDMAMLVAVFFLIFAMGVAFQLPLFFKLGYTKAKFLSYLPLVLVPLAFYLFGTFADMNGISGWGEQIAVWTEANRGAAYTLLLGAGLLLLSASVQVSNRVYAQREF